MAIFDKMIEKFADRIISKREIKSSDKKESVILNHRTEYDFEYDTPSSLIASKGWNYLEQVRLDTHVSDALDIRSKGLLSHEWDIRPPKNATSKDIEITEFVKWVIDNMEGSFIDDLSELMDGVFYGYSLSEIIWGICNQKIYSGKTIINSLRSKHPKNWKFTINDSGNAEFVVNRNYENKKYRLDKFVRATFGVSHKNPYGDPAAVKIAFWYWLKRNTAQFWAVFLEQWGSPTKKVITPVNPTPDEKTAIDNLIESFESSTNIKVPEGFDVELLEATRSGSANYDALVKTCNSEISKAIVGATLISEEGNSGGGSYALASSHSAILDMFIYFDAIKLSSIINEQYIKPLVNMNYDVDGRYPKFHFPSTLNKSVLMQNLQELVIGGMKISTDWVHSYLGIPMAIQGEEILLPAKILGNQPGQESQEKEIKPSNDKGTTFSEKEVFAEISETDKESEKLLKEKNAKTDEVVDYFSSLAYDAFDTIFEDVKKQIIKKLTDKNGSNYPEFSVNIGPINKLLTDQGMIAYTEGKEFALDQINNKLSEDDKIEFSERVIPLRFAESVFNNYFDDKNIITKIEFDKIATELKDRYFTVAGISKADIERIFNELMIALPAEWTVADFTTAMETAKIAYIGTKATISKDHVGLIFHNAAMSAFTSGEDAMYNDPAISDEIWGFKYYGINDGRQRTKHVKCNGVTLPKDHIFWKYHTPPWDHRCRCGRIVVFKQDIADGIEIQTEEANIPDVGNGWHKG